ncbi:hypothetical protein ACGFY7_13590 [Streptomyces prunicolor]|uniref:hypothetical protein n=1 Tax=Streptomyces prunicolor TaxID=67348 RepID=UPI0037249724
MSRTARLELLGLPDTDEEELLWLAGQLRRSLAELDVAELRSDHSAGGSAQGSKSGGLIATGTIVVTAASFVLRQALQLTDTWLKNRPVRAVRVELDGRVIELGQATAAERERLIDAFLSQDEDMSDNGEGDGTPEQPQGPAAV